MDVGVVRAGSSRAMRVDHRLRLLRRGRVVEVDERLAVDRLLAGSGNPRGSASHVEGAETAG